MCGFACKVFLTIHLRNWLKSESNIIIKTLSALANSKINIVTADIAVQKKSGTK